jgi:glycerol uptake facilitator-like aquaporin
VSLRGRIAGEAIGTAFLLMAVAGSGIMGERLAGGNVAIALLANSLATGSALAVLILVVAPISGAHFNPVVTVASAAFGELPWRDVGPYLLAQVAGAFLGVASAHWMFALGTFSWSSHSRTGAGQWWSEAVATFGLLALIRACQRMGTPAAPLAIGAYITAAYWFTASTSFANPAATVARMATDTFVGIRPVDVPGFIVAQAVGGAAALLLWRRPRRAG